ncbi:efflux RND transporter periplasmic adaptor subunit [Shewanella litorisediminis]|uniref:Efflux RND transporter periplasmic adaptor subunit n=1 Tax=Shewanella litorisediminis TaxID=1173586 RepID=A0ABX7G5D4_9GAMM|nr:efflux RND transporter periplasmic adaptor subunit [Shewanella litorisediminis]MCL2918002.1 efflux RND transporter periplasmic adaptor subunit [Shewanella litorisediminis]QRH02435.1 efflux RND transporter periplasmic adaptor subunit [Shewanella litorisediminis]
MSKLRPFPGIGIAAVLGALWFPSASQAMTGEAPRPVKVSQITLADGMNQRLLPAEVRASERAGLSFRVSGEIQQINVRPGEEVKAGQVLALLDPALYEQHLEVARAQYELAKVLYERNLSLVEQGVVSRNDFDKSKSNFDVAEAAFDKAQVELAYTRLLAPYDGVISKRNKRQFEFVRAQETVLGIRTENQIDVSFQLPEQFIGAIQRYQGDTTKILPPEVRFDSRDAWFTAKLKEMSTVADSATGSYTVILTLAMPVDLNVLPGMSALVRVSLPAKELDVGFDVPEGALVTEAGQTFVFRWLAEADKVEKVPVSIKDGKLVSGLNDGDFLVIAGADELKDGQAAVRWVKERGL